VDKPVHVSWGKNEAGSELKRILSELVLLVAGSFRPRTGLRVVRAQKMKKICRLQFRSSVGFAVGIDEQRKSNTGCFSKLAGIVHIAQANSRERGSGLLEFALVLAQLRDVLAAENSTIVPQEHNHSGIALPQGSEPYLAAGGIRQDENCQPAAERFFHDAIVIEQG
jgi:hypothetical protein